MQDKLAVLQTTVNLQLQLRRPPSDENLGRPGHSEQRAMRSNMPCTCASATRACRTVAANHPSPCSSGTFGLCAPIDSTRVSRIDETFQNCLSYASTNSQRTQKAGSLGTVAYLRQSAYGTALTRFGASFSPTYYTPGNFFCLKIPSC